MYFKYRQMTRWPALAWIAKLDPTVDAIEIDHGPRVEVRNDWFCEAIWAGDFPAGGFDQSDRVFGTGARMRDGAATFVSPGSLADRLVWIKSGNAIFISNSLVCLLNRIEASVDRTRDSYPAFFDSIGSGLGKHERELATSAGPVRFTYFDNLVWDGSGLREISKPSEIEYFESFEEYHEYLSASMQDLARNLRSASRQFPYSLLGVAGTDYSAAAVNALGASVGMREAISLENQSAPLHSIAGALRLSVTPIDRQASWNDEPRGESMFIAADGVGGTGILRSAERQLTGRVLVTPFDAEMIWNKPSNQSVPDELRGTSVCEYRLCAGFVHAPLASLGLRHSADVHRISVSGEMSRWEVGGSASQPVCRRIAERAGVPRYAIGVAKPMQLPAALNKSARQEYERWLRQIAPEFRQQWRVPPTSKLIPWRKPHADQFLFAWGLERAKQSYAISEPAVIRKAA